MTSGVIHTILGGANIGILVLATGAFFVRLFLARGEGTLGRTLDMTAYVAAIVGFSLALFTTLSGYFNTWSLPAVQNTLLTQNKILVSLALLGSWGMFIYIRSRLGPAMWRYAIAQVWSSILVIIGFANTVLAGSMGGSASLKGTALDPVFWALNINRFVSLAWGMWLNIALIVLSLVLVVFALVRRRGNSTPPLQGNRPVAGA
jgi:hypothetical protein